MKNENNVFITEKSKILSFCKEGSDAFHYDIPVKNLADIRDEGDGVNYSEWVMQVSEKIWSSTDILYRLAERINEHHPKNDIDWQTTFESAVVDADPKTITKRLQHLGLLK